MNKSQDKIAPGFRYVLEASLFFGFIAGLADSSYIFTRNPDLIADITGGLRLVIAGIVLNALAYILYLTVCWIVLLIFARVRKWPMKTTLTWLLGLAVLPAGAILARNYATFVASESILVAEVKVLFYFLKYLFILIPVSWAVGMWLADLRTKSEFRILYGKLSGIALAASFFMIATPAWLQRYFVSEAGASSQVAANTESLVMAVVFFAIALVLLPVLMWFIGKIGKVRYGLLLSACWILAFVIPYIPPLLSPPSTEGTGSAGPELAGKPSNVILVSLDTTRFDDLGFNGSEIVETPNLDALAGESVNFTNAVTPMPMTGPAHMSMLTGLQPDSENGHGVKSNGISLPEDIPTLATILDEHGYNTGAVVAGFPLSRQASGLQRGFRHYHDVFDEGFRARFLPDQVWYLTPMKILRRFFSIEEGLPHGRVKSADVVTDQSIEWLEENSDDPFFMFVHYFDPHYLYAPPPPFDTMYMPDYDGPYKLRSVFLIDLLRQLPGFTEDDFEYYRSLYRGEISFMDREFGRLIDWGEENGIWDNTLLIVLADHGESFEHDYYFSHTDRVYEQLVHVPFMIRSPETVHTLHAGSENDTLINVSDIFFTVLGYLNIDPPDSADTIHEGVLGDYSGWDHDLTGLTSDTDSTDGPRGWLFIPCQSYSFVAEGAMSMGRFFCFRFEDNKLIYSPDAGGAIPEFQFFDLETDPDEIEDIFDEILENDPGLPEVMEMLALWASTQSAADLSELDPQVRAQIEALGYANVH